jgi:hypothetical protein
MEETKLKMNKKKKVFLFVVLVSIAFFAYRPNREWLCQNANICIRSCEEYSGKPVHLTFGTGSWSCEQVELSRKQEFINQIKKLFWGAENNNPHNLKTLKFEKPSDVIENKEGDDSHE